MLRLVTWVLGAFVVLFFVVYNFYFSVNFPFQDDFLLIQFIETVTTGKLGFAGVVRELFRTFNDHKAVVPRLVALLDYSLTGSLHFRFYIVLVLVNITCIFSFVYMQFRRSGLPFYYFLPAVFLFFQPLFHEISGWALNGMQHTFLTAFTVTAIWLVSRKSRVSFYAAMFFCFLATFTHGNGILSYPAIIFYLLCFKDIRQALFTGGFMLLSLGIYLAGYESGQALRLPDGIAAMLTAFFGFIGSSMSLWGNPALFSMLAGVIITAFMAFIFAKILPTYRGQPVSIRPGTVELLALFGFIVVTSTVVALFRSWTGSTLASRFQIYASLSLVIFYVMLVWYVPLFRRRGVIASVCVLSVFYWIYAYYAFTGIVAAKRTSYLADVFNWSENRDMYSVERSVVNNARFYLEPAYRKRIFRVPDPVATKAELLTRYRTATAPVAEPALFLEPWNITRLVKDGEEKLRYFFLESNVYPAQKAFLDDRFLVLINQKSNVVHLMPAMPKVAARRAILTSGTYYKDGFSTRVRLDDLETGSYHLGILDRSAGGAKTFYRLGQELLVTKNDLFVR